MESYKFETYWVLEAPVAAVWDEIVHPLRWPEWWTSVKSVKELRAGDILGVGSIHRYTWRGALPYYLTFDMETTEVRKHTSLEGIATGELAGRGRWTFSSEGQRITHVRYAWHVDANKPWMRALSPLLRRAFEWNHDVVMTRGLVGLTKRLTQATQSGPGQLAH